jgi:hypothetical protein
MTFRLRTLHSIQKREKFPSIYLNDIEGNFTLFWCKIFGCCSSPKKGKISFYIIQIFKRKFFPFSKLIVTLPQKREKFPFKNLDGIEGNFTLFRRRAAPENLPPKRQKFPFFPKRIRKTDK